MTPPVRPVPIVLLACLAAAACGPDRAPPPTPAADPSVAWGRQLRVVVSPNGEVDYTALRADPEALRDYVGWVASHGPESDKWRYTDDNKRLAYALNALNANTLLAVVEGGAPPPADGPPFAALRFTLDREVVRYDRHLAHAVLAVIEEPLAVAALGCAAWSCPPMPARLFQKSGLDEDLAAQMGWWIGSGRLVWAADAEGGGAAEEGGGAGGGAGGGGAEAGGGGAEAGGGGAEAGGGGAEAGGGAATLVFSPALRPWLSAFARYAGADTPCAIVAPYVPEARKATLGPLLAGECRFAWGAWEGRLDGG